MSFLDQPAGMFLIGLGAASLVAIWFAAAHAATKKPETGPRCQIHGCDRRGIHQVETSHGVQMWCNRCREEIEAMGWQW